MENEPESRLIDPHPGSGRAVRDERLYCLSSRLRWGGFPRGRGTGTIIQPH